MNRNFYNGTVDPVPAGFMPESDMAFYATQAAIHPETVKILGVSEPWGVSAPDPFLILYWTVSPGVVANSNYKFTSSDPSVASTDMVSEWYSYYDSEGGLSGVVNLHNNGLVTISVEMQDGSLTDSITLSITGLGTTKVNVHTVSGQEELATPVLKSAESPSDTSVIFRWDAVSGADGYIVCCEWVNSDWVDEVANVHGGATTSLYLRERRRLGSRKFLGPLRLFDPCLQKSELWHRIQRPLELPGPRRQGLQCAAQPGVARRGRGPDLENRQGDRRARERRQVRAQLDQRQSLRRHGRRGRLDQGALGRARRRSPPPPPTVAARVLPSL